ncbi:WXG100 family type VII secretion target [Micromonospora sp. NPDC049559]|uniref:WXG100 family type VII secretion target n=1 Tax=Micromonospora sp. NPDC049559 TaxID=3155923 RepID=UPI00343D4711
MVTYSVDVTGNTDGVQSLRGVTMKLQESLRALVASAERFKAANAGYAIDSYDEAQRLWNEGMREMQDALNTKGTNLGRITENYVQTDAQGAALFGR